MSDVAVVGAGPSGLAAAVLLARQGRRVTLFERFDKARPVGAGFLLQPTGLAVLDDLDLTDAVAAFAQPIDHIFGREARRDRVVLDVRYRDLRRPRHALGVHRAALFKVLHDAALAEGVTVETGREMVAAEDGYLTDGRGRRAGAFDLVVDASGARSRIAAALGAAPRSLAFGALWGTIPWPGEAFDECALQQVYRAADKMIGILPVGARPGSPDRLATFFWSLKADDHPAWITAGLDVWKDEVLSFWPELAPALDAIARPEDLTLARYGHHTLRRRPLDEPSTRSGCEHGPA